jgi:uncharacterized protein (DUF2141 family)
VKHISVRLGIVALLAAACLIAASCSGAPGTIELTVSNSVGMDSETGTLIIRIRESKSGDLAASASVAGHTLDSGNPYEYSYGGASQGTYSVIAFLDKDISGDLSIGDIIPTGTWPSADVNAGETTTVSLVLDSTM